MKFGKESDFVKRIVFKLLVFIFNENKNKITKKEYFDMVKIWMCDNFILDKHGWYSMGYTDT